ncbi:uncharacterized protein LOC102807539 [Saccoglossus kowalevskii]|uniref:Uncharacterized protein LOC102807539 n=1 Tax=Saccoglossus kowalevskii TaxID=10224 RepID=A0ABM0MQC9_SACKO|nr:PREDICTED: uncharacterized protein LOC102807539 [Saccoglossus kowalevskii]
MVMYQVMNNSLLILLAILLIKSICQDSAWTVAAGEGVGEEDETADDDTVMPPQQFVPPLDGLPPWRTDDEEDGGGNGDGMPPPRTSGTSSPMETWSAAITNATSFSNNTTTPKDVWNEGDGTAGSGLSRYHLHCVWMIAIPMSVLVSMTSLHL